MQAPVPLLILVAFLLSALPALAQEGDSSRYTLETSDEGFVRLDRQTGAMTLCKAAEGILTCRMGADERAAYDADLARLEKRVDALEIRLNGTAPAGQPLPSDTEIDRSIGIMERFMRSFFGLVQEFKSEKENPPADRT